MFLLDPAGEGQKFLRTRLKANGHSDDLSLSRFFGDGIHVRRRIKHSQQRLVPFGLQRG